MGTGCMKLEVPKTIKNQDTNNLDPKVQRGVRGRLSRHQSQNYIEASAAEIEVGIKVPKEDRETILQALNNHFIFTSLTEEDKDVVSDTMQLYKFEAGKVVFEQDRTSKSYYVVKYGSLEVLVNGKRVSKIHAGEGFGELALLHDNPRAATVRTLEKSAMWGIDRATFRRVIEEMNTTIYEQNREFLEKVHLLQPLNPQQKDSLAASLVSEKHLAGQKIINEGDEGNNLYIIREGTVQVKKGQMELARLGKGDFFGEMALLYKVPRQATCIAMEGGVKCVVLSRDDLQKALGNQLTEIIEKNTILEALNKSVKLYFLSKDQKEGILRDLEYRTYKAGDIVIPNQSLCQSNLYIIISGRLYYAKTSLPFSEKGACIGDDFVTLSNQDQARYEDDMIAGCDAKIGELTKYKFENAIGGKYKEVVRENNAMNVLRRVYLFSSLDSKTLKDLFSMIDIKKYRDGEIIFKEGTFCDNLYIVKRGKINVLKNNQIVRTICKHDYVGERGILSESTTSASCVADGNASLWIISKNNFINILNEKMKQQLFDRINMQDEKAQLHDLEVIKRLGKGVYARVYLVRVKNTKKLYALKVLPRRKINVLVIQEHIQVKAT
jgi:cGMP-dependent protein kinase